jgi:NDP-sugar pyrophosphorylase family protein
MSGETQERSVRAVVLAGGLGTRLEPYTSVLPKPLMPIGNRAILEIVVDQLADSGVREITFCVGYLSHLIRAVFDHRVDDRTEISYVYEQEPLGTAGPVRLVDGLNSTFIVMNGDILTTLDFEHLVGSHVASGAALTIATHMRTIKSDYGILHLDGNMGPVRRVTGYEEKPEVISAVSMGIYVLEPRALAYIPDGSHFDFPDLVFALLAAGENVGAYPHAGVWFDIGRPEDHARAVELWETVTKEAGERPADRKGLSDPAHRARVPGISTIAS